MLTNLYVKSVVALDQLRKDERGVTAIEYGLIAAAVAIVVAAAFATDGGITGSLESIFESLADTLSAAVKDLEG